MVVDDNTGAIVAVHLGKETRFKYRMVGTSGDALLNRLIAQLNELEVFPARLAHRPGGLWLLAPAGGIKGRDADETRQLITAAPAAITAAVESNAAEQARGDASNRWGFVVEPGQPARNFVDKGTESTRLGCGQRSGKKRRLESRAVSVLFPLIQKWRRIGKKRG